ncbi:hypothetical protein ABFG93_21210 (plasmid) [Pseudalkalibacillus hwajinpoensis]|uniref:hypothetical protein n=1 Tax=Guptibacillus hwajinpoensis TaxID=208199 RepID=UPI00325BD1EE
MKTMYNQLLYSSSRAGVDSGLTKKALQTLNTYTKIALIVLYLFWFTLAFLFQIFFHYVDLLPEQMNLVILLFGILGLCFFLGYTVNEDFRTYAMTNSFSANKKKKLILTNEYLSAILIWGFIVIMAAPFLVGQVILNGLVGLVFMTQFLLCLFVAGYFIGFLKFSIYTLQNSYTKRNRKIVSEGIYLLIAVLVFHNREVLFKGFYFFIQMLLQGNLAKWIMGIAPKSIDLYHYQINLLTAPLIAVTMLLCVIVSYKLVEVLLKEKATARTGRRFRLPPGIYLDQIRQKGIINMNFLIAFVGTLSLLMYLLIGGWNAIGAVMLSSYLLVNLMVSDKQVNLVLLYKRHHSSVRDTAYHYSIYPTIQYFVVYAILFASLESASNHVSFLIGGILFIISSIFVYISSIFRLEYWIDSALLSKVARVSILIFIGITIGLEFLFYLSGLNHFLLILCIPIIAAFVMHYAVLLNFKKIRGFLYERTHNDNAHF